MLKKQGHGFFLFGDDKYVIFGAEQLNISTANKPTIWKSQLTRKRLTRFAVNLVNVRTGRYNEHSPLTPVRQLMQKSSN